MLSREEEKELSTKVMETGCIESRNKLVTENMGIVHMVARSYYGMNADKGVQYEDLVQWGLLGVLRAAEKYDWRFNTRFATYATWWARQSIRRNGILEANHVEVPPYVKDIYLRYSTHKSKLRPELNREPTIAECAESMGMPVAKLESIVNKMPQMFYLDMHFENDNGHDMDEILPPGMLQIACKIKDNSDALDIDKILANADLTDREREIIEKRYLNEYTLHQVGKLMKLTRERIRQIEKKALAKLRNQFAPKTKRKRRQ